MNDYLLDFSDIDSDLFNFKGLDLGSGKRDVDLKEENKKINQKIPLTVSELAEFKEIPMEAALRELGGGRNLIPVVPVAKKADTFVEKMKKSGLRFFPTPAQIGGAEFYEQEYDPKLKRLVGKNRPTGLQGALAQILDASTFGLTDFDQQGGGLFGSAKSLRGFGGQPTDFKLSKTIKDQLKTEIEEVSKNPVESTKEAAEAIIDFNTKMAGINRKNKLIDTALESAVMRANMPFVTNTLKDITSFKQQQLLDAEAIKQGMPNAVQTRLLAGDTGFAQQAAAIAAAQDAATRMAAIGVNPRNVSFSA
tara:strand:+ start:1021 stop:1941 length:921 start_codon:yes stop_codon:yes gene_type:complete